VHSRRLVGKWLGEAEASAEPHSDFAGSPDAAEPRCLVLAIIDQAVAVATGEDPASGIRESHPGTLTRISRLSGRKLTAPFSKWRSMRL
jgi:hypothetical protein